MMPGEGHPLQLSNTCGTFIYKAPLQPLPDPRGLEAAKGAEGNAEASLGKSSEHGVGAA